MRKTSIGAAISLVASLALASSVLAVGAFTNGSFETANTGFTAPTSGYTTLVAGTANATAMDGWTVTAGSVDWTASDYWPAEDGTLSVDINGSGPGADAGTISQTFATTVNDTYTVEFWVSNNTRCVPSTRRMTVSVGGVSETVEVDTSYSAYLGQWFPAEPLSFVATSDSATLTFAAANSGPCGVALDNVSITQTPSTGAQCKQGGWQSMLQSADFMPFKNQGSCVSSYAKAGMVPIGNVARTADQPGDTGATSDPGAQCKQGGWQSLTDASNNSFKNQGACVSYYARGGK